MTYSFGLPESFRVNKQIERETFINNASLTKAERRDLNKHLKSVRIVYDIWFNDNSELIFLDVSINYAMNPFTMPRIAYCVASSLPYKTVILVHSKDMAKIFSFNSKVNKKSELRTSIINYAGSPYFDMSKPCFYLPDYALIIDKCSTAQECCEALVRDTKIEAEMHNDIAKEQREVEGLSIDELLYSLKESDEIEYSLYSKYNEDNSTHKSFVYDCANYCYGLFLEYCENFMSDDLKTRWFLIYMDVCNEIADSMGIDSLTYLDLEEIATEFNSNYDFRINNFQNECFDVDVIRELLDERYW